nr:aminopeptidase [Fodinibius sp.]NIV16044.1 aminopeptidase [Fodinibius sp.]NIY29998.1 aminopeptidase [Fodinibius sp.]
MADPRVTKLAQVLVNYSLNIQPGEQLVISSTPQAETLIRAVYKEAILAGAHVTVQNDIQGLREIFFKYANEEQLNYESPVQKMFVEQFDAELYIEADYNTRSLAGVDPVKQKIARQASADLHKIFIERAARGEFKWCLTVFPTNAAAQEADMSLSEYEDFVYGAGLLHLDDPVAAWLEVAANHKRLVGWMAGKKQVVLKGKNIDLEMS